MGRQIVLIKVNTTKPTNQRTGPDQIQNIGNNDRKNISLSTLNLSI